MRVSRFWTRGGSIVRSIQRIFATQDGTEEVYTAWRLPGTAQSGGLSVGESSVSYSANSFRTAMMSGEPSKNMYFRISSRR